MCQISRIAILETGRNRVTSRGGLVAFVERSVLVPGLEADPTVVLVAGLTHHVITCFMGAVVHLFAFRDAEAWIR